MDFGQAAFVLGSRLLGRAGGLIAIRRGLGPHRLQFVPKRGQVALECLPIGRDRLLPLPALLLQGLDLAGSFLDLTGQVGLATFGLGECLVEPVDLGAVSLLSVAAYGLLLLASATEIGEIAPEPVGDFLMLPASRLMLALRIGQILVKLIHLGPMAILGLGLESVLSLALLAQCLDLGASSIPVLAQSLRLLAEPIDLRAGGVPVLTQGLGLLAEPIDLGSELLSGRFQLIAAADQVIALLAEPLQDVLESVGLGLMIPANRFEPTSSVVKLLLEVAPFSLEAGALIDEAALGLFGHGLTTSGRVGLNFLALSVPAEPGLLKLSGPGRSIRFVPGGGFLELGQAGSELLKFLLGLVVGRSMPLGLGPEGFHFGSPPGKLLGLLGRACFLSGLEVADLGAEPIDLGAGVLQFFEGLGGRAGRHEGLLILGPQTIGLGPSLAKFVLKLVGPALDLVQPPLKLAKLLPKRGGPLFRFRDRRGVGLQIGEPVLGLLELPFDLSPLGGLLLQLGPDLAEFRLQFGHSLLIDVPIRRSRARVVGKEGLKDVLTVATGNPLTQMLASHAQGTLAARTGNAHMNRHLREHSRPGNHSLAPDHLVILYHP